VIRKPFVVSPKFCFLISFFYFLKMWLMRDKDATSIKKSLLNKSAVVNLGKISTWIATVIFFIACERKIISYKEQQWNLYGAFNLEEGQSQWCM